MDLDDPNCSNEEVAYSLFQPVTNDVEQRRREIAKQWLINRNRCDLSAQGPKRTLGRAGQWFKR